MELRTVDPRKLKANPNNPRRTSAGDFLDAQLTASIKAIGLVQPPLVLDQGKKLVILAGHRRVACAVGAGLTEIQVLVQAESDAEIDPMRAISENVVRAEMGQVDRWRAIEGLTAAGWTEPAIAEALGLTPRNIAQARLLANICPAMLDQMARNDLPDQRCLRIIAAAPKEEQAEVWKAHKPKRGHEADWSEMGHALSKVRLKATDASFGAAEAEAYGIIWEDDLFAPADQDNRSTTQVNEFFAAQVAWLEVNMAPGDSIVSVDEWGRPQLPAGAVRYYGEPTEGMSTAHLIDKRTGRITAIQFIVNERPKAAEETLAPVGPKVRPNLTNKGAAMVGDLRTDALHKALRQNAIDDDQLLAMLVLALGSRNVTTQSGVVGHYRGAPLARLAESLTEGGVITRDLTTIRQAAREALVEVLSCRDNHSASGMSARYTGDAINADEYLPNMATEEFLPALSRAALERSAEEHGVERGARVKDTRAALLARFADDTFIYPGARFAPTEAELEARRNPASVFPSFGSSAAAPEFVTADESDDEITVEEDGDALDHQAAEAADDGDEASLVDMHGHVPTVASLQAAA